MTLQTNEPTEGYRVRTTIYEGPLDLLLALIERAELDITKMALAQVTDQFLQYLINLEDRDLDEMSSFLVVAARLLYIKSITLLPRQSQISLTPEEDPGETLARQLIEYRRFKQIATWLENRDAAGLRSYLRVAPPVVKFEPKLDFSDINLNDLERIAYQIFITGSQLSNLSDIVAAPRITIREKIYSIIETLQQNPGALFHHIPKSHSRIEIVVTFLALLELIKRHIVEVEQISTFGDIQLMALRSWDENEDTQLEFGE